MLDYLYIIYSIDLLVSGTIGYTIFCLESIKIMDIS